MMEILQWLAIILIASAGIYNSRAITKLSEAVKHLAGTPPKERGDGGE